jgi:hypothetical protein
MIRRRLLNKSSYMNFLKKYFIIDIALMLPALLVLIYGILAEL